MDVSSKQSYESLVRFSLVFVIFITADYLSVSNNFLVSASVRGNDWKDLLLTRSEKEKLDLFKNKVSKRLPEEYMKTDFYLIRWLRAKNYNAQAAEDMLFENLKWRETNQIGNILKEDFSDVSEDFPVYIDEFDKQGRPVVNLDMGSWDLRAAVLQGKLPRVLRYMDWVQETMVQKILDAQKAGKSVTRGVVLVDVEGFNLRQHLCSQCMAVFIRMTVGMESHYPGFWEEILVVNAPASSRIGLQAVRPVMSQQTRETLKIFDTNKREWMTYLNERIDKNQLYTNFGGSKKRIE